MVFVFLDSPTICIFSLMSLLFLYLLRRRNSYLFGLTYSGSIWSESSGLTGSLFPLTLNVLSMTGCSCVSLLETISYHICHHCKSGMYI